MEMAELGFPAWCHATVYTVICKRTIEAWSTRNGILEHMLGKGAPCYLWPPVILSERCICSPAMVLFYRAALAQRAAPALRCAAAAAALQQTHAGQVAAAGAVAAAAEVWPAGREEAVGQLPCPDRAAGAGTAGWSRSASPSHSELARGVRVDSPAALLGLQASGLGVGTALEGSAGVLQAKAENGLAAPASLEGWAAAGSHEVPLQAAAWVLLLLLGSAGWRVGGLDLGSLEGVCADEVGWIRVCRQAAEPRGRRWCCCLVLQWMPPWQVRGGREGGW